ncbi:MAG: putative maltokinase, partial [Burkholderia gladioli]
TQVFGRGTLRFLRPENRKILAYLRELPDATPVLCVANLSRASQAVELDLSEFAGSVPVEMTSESPFPAIGELPYLLTFPPYGFLWFALTPHGAEPAWHRPHAEPLPEYTTLVMRRGDLHPAAPLLASLETEVLPHWLALRRWFAAKDRTLDGARFECVTPIPGETFQYAEVAARSGGREERYVVPLAAAWGDETPHPLFMRLALARVRRGPTVGYLTDAFALPGFAHGVLRKLAQRASVPLDSGGALTFSPEPSLDDYRDTLGDAPEVRWLAAEQSNSSLVIGETLVLKLVRRVAGGIHPEAEVSRYLTRAGYRNAPALVGEVLRVAEDGTPHTVAIVQAFVENQGDAWTHSLDFVKRAVGDLALTGAATPDGTDATPADTEALDAYADFAGAIGTRLGELHAVLAAPSDDPAFAPERATPAHVERWIGDATAMVERALHLLAPRLDELDPAAREAAQALLASRDALLAALAASVPRELDAICTRIHGDFHLGQVLNVNGDAMLIDFEGEPARALDARRAKSHPLRDVAGLLRSLSYASAAAQFSIEKAPLPTADLKRTLFDRFGQAAADRFLAHYRHATHAVAEPFVAPADADRLLMLFLIEKAAYEIGYEAANRPDWLRVPVLGLAALAAQLLNPSAPAAGPRDTTPPSVPKDAS